MQILEKDTQKERIRTMHHLLVWTNKGCNLFTSGCHSLATCTVLQLYQDFSGLFVHFSLLAIILKKKYRLKKNYGTKDSTDTVDNNGNTCQIKTIN